MKVCCNFSVLKSVLKRGNRRCSNVVISPEVRNKYDIVIFSSKMIMPWKFISSTEMPCSRYEYILVCVSWTKCIIFYVRIFILVSAEQFLPGPLHVGLNLLYPNGVKSLPKNACHRWFTTSHDFCIETRFDNQ